MWHFSVTVSCLVTLHKNDDKNPTRWEEETTSLEIFDHDTSLSEVASRLKLVQYEVKLATLTVQQIKNTAVNKHIKRNISVYRLQQNHLYNE